MDHALAGPRRARGSADHGRTQSPFLADRSSLLYRRPQGSLSAGYLPGPEAFLFFAMRKLALAVVLGASLLCGTAAYPYEAAPVANGGTITGIVKFDCAAPR